MISIEGLEYYEKKDVDEAYGRGYEDGYDKGRDEGYEEGFTDGVEEGRNNR